MRRTLVVVREAVTEYLRSGLFALAAWYVVLPFWAIVSVVWPYSTRSLFVVATMVIHDGLYYGFHFFFQLCEARGWLQQYKIPRTRGQIPSPELVSRAIKESLFGHFVLQPITLWVLYPYVTEHDLVSSPAAVVGKFIFFMFVNDFLFFLSHWYMHENKWLYSKVHKQHHLYSGSIGIAAEFAHPVEQILGNQLPLILPVFLLKTDCYSWCIYVFWRLWRTYEGHCGYSFAGTLPSRLGLLHGYSALFHDFHHSANVSNFTGPAHGLFDHFLGVFTGRPVQAPWLKHCRTTKFQPEAHKRWL
mmetsp:Transcript_43491/g.85140  ORF Transcript_43491/g.85140 Transcript_43491/m.85140 type:complete len:302 (+) Transcript_43491:38-943(+)